MSLACLGKLTSVDKLHLLLRFLFHSVFVLCLHYYNAVYNSRGSHFSFVAVTFDSHCSAPAKYDDVTKNSCPFGRPFNIVNLS